MSTVSPAVAVPFTVYPVVEVPVVLVTTGGDTSATSSGVLNGVGVLSFSPSLATAVKDSFASAWPKESVIVKFPPSSAIAEPIVVPLLLRTSTVFPAVAVPLTVLPVREVPVVLVTTGGATTIASAGVVNGVGVLSSSPSFAMAFNASFAVA
ncbi:hypothetical protein RV18_GL003639 [Enterococcus termitis]|nr:hypothetical protein RV18_GL003639 [Enterococcus termitis]